MWEHACIADIFKFMYETIQNKISIKKTSKKWRNIWNECKIPFLKLGSICIFAFVHIDILFLFLFFFCWEKMTVGKKQWNTLVVFFLVTEIRSMLFCNLKKKDVSEKNDFPLNFPKPHEKTPRFIFFSKCNFFSMLALSTFQGRYNPDIRNTTNLNRV